MTDQSVEVITYRNVWALLGVLEAEGAPVDDDEPTMSILRAVAHGMAELEVLMMGYFDNALDDWEGEYGGYGSDEPEDGEDW